jgi:hypothetical protein
MELRLTFSFSTSNPVAVSGRSLDQPQKRKEANLFDSPRAKAASQELDWPNVFGLPAFRTFGDTELNGLTLLQALKTARLNRREMYKNVFAILTADEAVALGIVKPLHCSLFHDVVLVFLFLNFTLEGVGRTLRR